MYNGHFVQQILYALTTNETWGPILYRTWADDSNDILQAPVVCIHNFEFQACGMYK